MKERLIDRFLPEYQFSNTHRMTIYASAEKVYNSILELDLGKSLLIRILFRLRGMPRSALSFKELENTGFSVLGEQPGSELLLGIAGQFWKLKSNMQKVDSTNFISFHKPGYAKAVWNFYLSEAGGNGTVLSTETRIYCTDPKSTRRFRFYWFVITPFSGWIRREMLRLIKAATENKT